jgi:hypothetical protein
MERIQTDAPLLLYQQSDVADALILSTLSTHNLIGVEKNDINNITLTYDNGVSVTVGVKLDDSDIPASLDDALRITLDLGDNSGGAILLGRSALKAYTNSLYKIDHDSVGFESENPAMHHLVLAVAGVEDIKFYHKAANAESVRTSQNRFDKSYLFIRGWHLTFNMLRCKYVYKAL